MKPSTRPSLALLTAAVLAPSSLSAVAGDENKGDSIASLVAAQTAVERVYHDRRTGNHRPFEEAVPAAAIEAKVRLARKKERLLEQVYGVVLADDQLAEEVARINANTRAPEMLAEIKAALGDDRDLFARAFARPILVERELRKRFTNDNARHSGQRAKVTALRQALLEITGDGALEARRSLLEKSGAEAGIVDDITWQLGPRPKMEAGTTAAPGALPPEPDPDGTEAKRLASPHRSGQSRSEETEYYLEDLHPELRKVLSAQLHEPGSVSAVIELPQSFLLYLATERSEHHLSALAVSVPKSDYTQWVKHAELR